MPAAVLDASAILCFLKREPGAEIVEQFREGASITSVNFAEIVTKLVDRGVKPDEVAATLSLLGLEIIPADETLAFRAGTLRAETRHLGLSLGDRFCLALGERLGLPVITADRAWTALTLDITIRSVR